MVTVTLDAAALGMYLTVFVLSFVIGVLYGFASTFLGLAGGVVLGLLGAFGHRSIEYHSPTGSVGKALVVFVVALAICGASLFANLTGYFWTGQIMAIVGAVCLGSQLVNVFMHR